MTAVTAAENPMLRVLSLRDCQLLFGGAATSLLGDQFALIATPWLVLQLTGDPLALGVVLALEGLPRAVVMLVGGVLTDRYSARRIMLAADALRVILVAMMAGLVFTEGVEMWMLYAFGVVFGLISGIAIPAQESIVPMLVPEQDLQAGNSLVFGLGQFAAFIGPSAAGILIGSYAHSLMGIGLAFAVDAFSFAVSAVCLWLMREVKAQGAAREGAEQGSMWTSILDGVKYLWADAPMRLMFLVALAVNFLLAGPMLVGIPVLADERLPEGALAFGLLMSADAGGNLVGYLLAGVLPRPTGKALLIIMITVLVVFGVVFTALAFIRSTWIDFAILFVQGFGNGYFIIIYWTWVQARSRKDMLGRVMSLVTLASMGLVPFSQAISGAVIRWDFDLLFIGAGALTILLAIWTALQPAAKALSESMAGETASRATA